MGVRKRLHLALKYFTGRFRFTEFALNNVCTTQCTHCSIWSQKKKINLPTDTILKAIKKLKELDVCCTVFTGGEPVLNSQITNIISECEKNYMITVLNIGNCHLLNEQKIQDLAKAGLDFLLISVEDSDEARQYQSRKVSNLFKKAVEIQAYAKKAGIKPIAAILITHDNVQRLPQIVADCSAAGFENIWFNYPEISLSQSYTLGGENVKFDSKQLAAIFEEILELNKKYHILNPKSSILNLIQYYKGKPVDYPCYAGSCAFFVDWNLNVFPCMHVQTAKGELFKITKRDFKKTECNSCGMSYWRDVSVLFNGTKSVKPLLEMISDLLR